MVTSRNSAVKYDESAIREEEGAMGLLEGDCEDDEDMIGAEWRDSGL